MIVITSLNPYIKYVTRGDTFQLSVTDDFGARIVISEDIEEDRMIDFIASFRFALDDGTCPGFHFHVLG